MKDFFYAPEGKRIDSLNFFDGVLNQAPLQTDNTETANPVKKSRLGRIVSLHAHQTLWNEGTGQRDYSSYQWFSGLELKPSEGNLLSPQGVDRAIQAFNSIVTAVVTTGTKIGTGIEKWVAPFPFPATLRPPHGTGK